MRHEQGKTTQNEPQLLNPILDISTFLPHQWNRKKPYPESVIFENDSLYVVNYYHEGIIGHTVYDRNNVFPNYSLQHDELYDFFKFQSTEYDITFDPDLMDKPLITATKRDISAPNAKLSSDGSNSVTKFDMNLDQTTGSRLDAFCSWEFDSSHVYSREITPYDESCDELLATIHEQLSRIPRQRDIYMSRHLLQPPPKFMQ